MVKVKDEEHTLNNSTNTGGGLTTNNVNSTPSTPAVVIESSATETSNSTTAGTINSNSTGASSGANTGTTVSNSGGGVTGNNGNALSPPPPSTTGGGGSDSFGSGGNCGGGPGVGGKMPGRGTSNLATQHFHYHWSYPSAGPPLPPGGGATFHFGPGFEPQTSPHQHVVYFHVNPGVTVSFQMGDNVQTIKGPMTVPMVSTNSSPPIAMPVQVPHGHVVQQIVDENGTLRHVILSPQHPPLLPIPQHFGGGNPSGANQPQGFYPGMAHGYHQPFSPIQPGVLGHPQGHSPPPHNFHKDERAQRRHNKLKKKIEQKHQREHPLNTTPPLSPRKEINGNSRKGVGSVGTSEDGEESSSLQDEEEDMAMLTDLLGNIKPPQVSEVTSRTALVEWSAPQVDNPQDLSYEVLLSDRGKEGKYKSIYSGEALSCRIEDLRPGTEYFVCVSARLENVIGCASEPTLLVTQACKPDPPLAPKLSSRSRNALTLKWLAAPDNGAHIDYYIVEWDIDGTFTEITRSKSKQAHISKLQPATSYVFRIAAVNQHGKSDYSPAVEYQTCDTPPPQPQPPALVHATPNSLAIQWQARPQDDDFTLQMEEPDSRHGFLPVYNGKDTFYLCQCLRVNTSYRFRLKSQNGDGSSRWSDDVVFTTLPGRPGPPTRPQLKGKMHLHSFRLKWDPPVDKGGSTITSYTLEIMKHKDGGDYEVAYTGANPMCTIERLEPGTAYNVRVRCEGPGGISDYSELALLATEPVCPGQCQPPRLHGKPKPHTIPIKWSYPESDGGSPVIEMEVGVKRAATDEEIKTAYRGKETECVVGDLRPAQTYALMVRASNKIGAGPWSLPLEVTSGSCAPSRPAAPTVNLLPGGVACSWTPPDHNGSPITQYIIQMSTPPCETYNSVFVGLTTHCEVKPVPPATLCVFRVQATNAIGTSDWSELGTVLTSAGPPGVVPNLRYSATPTSVSLSWSQPQANGDPVTHYTVDAGDVSLTAVSTSCQVDNLTPNTTYRIRVRGVNNIGPGAVSTIKVTTQPLPPSPPQLSCATAGHNFLKLRWGSANSNPNNHIFTVAMTSRGRRQIVYEGTSTSCKVPRLQEQTEYSFTIVAANTTGKGPESEAYNFSTVIAPPPSVKGVKTNNVASKSCHVEWAPIRPMGNDRVDYTVQCARLRDQIYKQVYHGSETFCELRDLDAAAEYLIKVCAIRQTPNGPVEGPFCPPVSLSTPPVHQESQPQHHVRLHNHQVGGRKPLTDQQWAGIILSAFIVLAVLCAMLIAHIIY